ncbi:glucose 1-dehydrogenase [Peribacillus psychrosaccharolyticus]|uniref:Glucose 1-dehydrogenase n=1 Tax=Peribacillus psychrosaccharolyticus TaxID=1407 RepID=A0A974NIW6_PERPY|nr:glucose 1-dehydrogenase [Peribacillus psychrosaccharolyticus]MEC2057899.1 glucose 1-dehydrogenase [Peribacillus psychrosaccharolyticus]MED3744590.1 glucose 1-dehydrogenase [Peribacillus psychrosaccharolyticus]QQS98711.1 glucose 1-dehydrogenase [Peribacillus psychrosaccharolyticus]
MTRLQDKVAIITGSANGIGKAIAVRYAQEGAKIVIADFNEEALNSTVDMLKGQGVQAVGVKVNVAVEEDIQRMIDDSVAAFGRIDILVNCAGVLDKMQAAHNVEDDVWQRVMDINVGGVMRSTRKILPLFQAQGSGVIVNLSSIAGLTGGRGGFTYTAAKHAVTGMTKNIASHYGPQGIRCNAIAPAQVETGLVASMEGMDMEGIKYATRGVNMMPRAGQPEEIADIALFLASNESSYVNGVVMAADAGWSAY